LYGTAICCAFAIGDAEPGCVHLGKGCRVIKRPAALSAFEFAVLAGLRAGQLARGCTPRVDASDKVAVTAQMEIAEGKVLRSVAPTLPGSA
jgi:DNA-directed RNA polymerase subunit K/omega